MRGRPRRTTYLYDDPDHPDRVTGTVESPEWTPEDRGALLGLQAYEQTLCPGPCGQPRRLAWQLNGFYGVHTFLCDACTAMTGEGTERQDQIYKVAYLTEGAPVDDLDPMFGPVVAGPTAGTEASPDND